MMKEDELCGCVSLCKCDIFVKLYTGSRLNGVLLDYRDLRDATIHVNIVNCFFFTMF